PHIPRPRTPSTPVTTLVSPVVDTGTIVGRRDTPIRLRHSCLGGAERHRLRESRDRGRAVMLTRSRLAEPDRRRILLRTDALADLRQAVSEHAAETVAQLLKIRVRDLQATIRDRHLDSRVPCLRETFPRLAPQDLRDLVPFGAAREHRLHRVTIRGL